jgi:hypothetical protein
MPNFLAAIPGYARPVRVLRSEHRGTDHQRTAQTVERMQAHVALAIGHPTVVEACRNATAGLPRDASPRDIVEAVFAWVRRNITFRNDPPEDELLIDPRVLLELPRGRRLGDCDDFSMLGAAMLGTLGFRSRVVTIKADDRDPSHWSHVYLEVFLPNGERVPFDSSHGLEAGWEAPHNYGLARWGGGMLLGGLGDGFVLDPVSLPAGGFKQQAAAVGLTFLDRIGQAYAQRVAIPEGTVVQTPAGMIARGAPGPVGPILPQLSLGGATDMLPWVLIVGGVIVVARVLSKR